MPLLASLTRSGSNARQVDEERFEKKVEQAKSEPRKDIYQAESELKDDMNKVDRRLEQVKTELKTDIARVGADLIKWMFIFWAGQIITITSILIASLKK